MSRAWAGACALLAGALAYLTVTAGHLAGLYYLPTQHRWSTEAPTGVIAMDWYARSLWTFAATGLAWLVASRLPSRGESATRGVLVLGLIALAWCAAFTVMWLVSSR